MRKVTVINASCGTLYFYVADERSASPSCMNNCWLDISATTIEFESPISDVLEASHWSSGCLATSIVGSSVGLFGAWVKRARQPSDFYFCLASHTAAYTEESLSGRFGLVLGHDLNHGVFRGSI